MSTIHNLGILSDFFSSTLGFNRTLGQQEKKNLSLYSLLCEIDTKINLKFMA